MKMAVHKLWSAQKLFRRAVREVRSQRISGRKLSLHLSSPVTTRKLSIGNRPTKNSRREQGRKRKPPAHHLWLLVPRRRKGRSLRYWPKLSAPPQLHFNRQSDHAAGAPIHWQLQW